MSEMIKDRVFPQSDALFVKKLEFQKKAQWYPDLSAAQRLNFLQYHNLDAILLFLSSYILTLPVIS